MAHVSPLGALGNPVVWLLAVVYFAYYTVTVGYALWAPTLVREALETSDKTTGFVIGSISLFTTLAYVLAAKLSDRTDERCGMAAVGLVLASIGCVGAALLPPSLPRVATFVLIAMCSPVFLCSFWCLPTRFLKSTSAAVGIGLISAIGSSGGFFGPSIIGYLKQSSGSDAGGFWGLAGLALLGSIVCISFRQTARFKPSPATPA